LKIETRNKKKNDSNIKFVSCPKKYATRELLLPPRNQLEEPTNHVKARPLFLAGPLLWCKGLAKNNSATPVVGGWVRVRKKDGVRFFVDIFYRVFELPSPRKRPKMR
jgi:hypothetical protein